MGPDVLAVSILIVAIVATALILITAFYYKSREKQMLIEKGLSPEQIKEFFESKKDPNRLLKFGIIIFAFGLGLGLGIMMEDFTSKEFWIPLLLFTFTGLGFVVSGLVARKYDVKN
jgi:amino acid transporter